MTQINSLDRRSASSGETTRPTPLFFRAYVPDMESQGQPPRASTMRERTGQDRLQHYIRRRGRGRFAGSASRGEQGLLLFTITYLASKVRANLIGRCMQADGLVQP